MHYFNNLQLTLGNVIELTFDGENRVIKCGPQGAFTFVFVKAGCNGLVILRDGTLKVMEPGLHFLQAPDCLKTFVSVQQEHFTFGTRDAGQCFLTADNIELHLNATLFYRVTDVVTLFTQRIKDERSLHETLHSQALSTLLTIIRSEAFQAIGQRKQVKSMQRTLHSDINQEQHGDDAAEDVVVATAVPSAPSAPPTTAATKPDSRVEAELMLGFQNIVHDAEPRFQSMMRQNFSSSGVEIQSLRIEQIEFSDKNYQREVSNFALTNSKLQSQQQSISAQRALQVAEAERESATLLIRKRAEADSKLLTAQTDIDIKIRLAKSEAEQTIILAESQALAKIKVGEAEIMLQEKQNKMPFAELRIWTDAQRATFSNAEKIIYTDQQSLLLKPYLNLPDIVGAKPSLTTGGN